MSGLKKLKEESRRKDLGQDKHLNHVRFEKNSMKRALIRIWDKRNI